jgi:2-C-methyl-D-erythritol 4-phosphate cytidylyltransferase
MGEMIFFFLFFYCAMCMDKHKPAPHHHRHDLYSPHHPQNYTRKELQQVKKKKKKEGTFQTTGNRIIVSRSRESLSPQKR